MIDSKAAIEALVGLPRDNVMVSVYNRRIDAIGAAIQAIGEADRFET